MALALGQRPFLDHAATDYHSKARVRSILRRTTLEEQGTSTYSDSYLTLNLDSHEVAAQGRPLRLSPTEFRLLVYLTRYNDRVVTHHELLESVWGNDRGSLDSVKWHISSLRDKLEDNPSNPSLIVTVPRVGYRYYPP